jgi:PAS domain S-box-containing protein
MDVNINKEIFKDSEFYYSESLLLETCLISKADKYGKITYANEKFCKLSGYSYDELIGNDHKVVNSGYHTKEYWKEMYETVIKERKIWHDTVTNKNKNGELYYVKSWIQATFDKNNSFSGYISVRQDVTEIIKAKNEIDKKNAYLEHAAKILRHDMHSGINTYIPRGVSSLERRLSPEIIKELKIESPIKMIKEGLNHTQKVYRGVYEFTNMVKQNAELTKALYNLKEILNDYLKTTAYKDQVVISDLPTTFVNEPLFCTAIDNLIRNGLKYNDSATKYIKIYMEDECLIVEDNGRGMTPEEFEYLSKPYTRKEGQKETGTGLGLNICIEILKIHGFVVSCEKLQQGTKVKIKL